MMIKKSLNLSRKLWRREMKNLGRNAALKKKRNIRGADVTKLYVIVPKRDYKK